MPPTMVIRTVQLSGPSVVYVSLPRIECLIGSKKYLDAVPARRAARA
jgi:hypothetical protein